ncbi:MAG: hypothetical protein WCA49_15920, partial [Candidatus Sulfotelmatobacter sp.]
ATPSSGWYLGEWTGSCSAGSPIPPTTACSVTISGVEFVTAVFGNSNNAHASYSGTNPNNTSLAIVQPTATSVGGLIGAGTCQIPSDFSYPVCRLTDATWNSGPAVGISSITVSGSTVTVNTTLSPSTSRSVWINGSSASADNGIFQPATSSGSSFTITSSTMTACSSSCGNVSVIWSGNSNETLNNSAWNTINCNDQLVFFINDGGNGFVGALNTTYPFSLSHVYPNNPSWSEHGGFAGVADAGEWSRNCIYSPNLLYSPAGAPSTALMSYDFTGWASNPSGGPATSTVFNYAAGSTGSWGTTSENCLPSTTGPSYFGTVTVASNVVTWVSGTQFSSGWGGSGMNINGSYYSIVSVNSATSMTVQGGTGTGGPYAYSFTPSPPYWTDWEATSKNPADAVFAIGFSATQSSNYGSPPTANTVSITVTNGSNVFTVAATTAGLLHTDGTNDMAGIFIGCNTNSCTYAIQCVTGETGCTGGGTAGMGGLLTTPWTGATGTYSTHIWAGQDYATMLAVYMPGKGCAVLDTGTGVVTADSATGVVTGSTPLAPGGGYPTNGFYLHGARVTPGGRYVEMSFDSCVTGAPASCFNSMGYMWDLQASSIADAVFPMCGQTGGECTGHKTNGYGHVVNPIDPFPDNNIRAYGPNMASASPPYYTVNSTTLSPCTLGSDSDTHVNWVNVDANDTFPWITSSMLYADSAQIPGSYTCGFVDELFAITPPSPITAANGTLYRFGHSMITGLNGQYQVESGMEQISSDGNFAVFTSDWSCTSATCGAGGQLGTLGPEDLGTEACVNAATGSETNQCRGDLFIIGLQQ